jgi:hypothetical protein
MAKVSDKVTPLNATIGTLAFIVFLLGYASFRSEIFYIQTQLSDLFSAIFTGNIRF